MGTLFGKAIFGRWWANMLRSVFHREAPPEMPKAKLLMPPNADDGDHTVPLVARQEMWDRQ